MKRIKGKKFTSEPYTLLEILLSKIIFNRMKRVDKSFNLFLSINKPEIFKISKSGMSAWINIVCIDGLKALKQYQYRPPICMYMVSKDRNIIAYYILKEDGHYILGMDECIRNNTSYYSNNIIMLLIAAMFEMSIKYRNDGTNYILGYDYCYSRCDCYHYYNTRSIYL